MVGSVSASFVDLVTIGERIEAGMRSGKITQGYAPIDNSKKPLNNFNKKKEAEAHHVAAEPKYFPIKHQPNNFHYPPPTSQIPYPYMANASHSFPQPMQPSPILYRLSPVHQTLPKPTQ